MEKTDKPAEETLTDSLKGMSVKIPPVLLPHIINAMKSYAAQQLSEYKEYFELAEKAKQVLRDKGYGWTGLDILETCKLVPKADNES